MQPTKGAAMSAAPPPAPEMGECPRCSKTLQQPVVTTEGALLACDQCVDSLGDVGIPMTLAEWDDCDAVHVALEAFDISQYTLSKRPFGPALRPRANVWYVVLDGRRFVLRRHDNEAALRFEGALRDAMAAAHLPIMRFQPTRQDDIRWTADGATWWTLHPSPRGSPLPTSLALWNLAGGAGGTLGRMHAALRGVEAHDTPSLAWGCWSLERLRDRLAAWPALDDLTHEVRDRAIERLETRKTFETLPRLPQTITHGNFGRAAIFMEGFNLVGVCEFERAHRAAAIHDFAFGLVSQFKPVVRAAVSAYEHERPLEDAERDALPDVLLLGTLIRVDRQLTIWHDQAAANQYAKAIAHLLDNGDSLRDLKNRAPTSHER
jgi:Ser/Thr protein kinase RdoA (MazF antagonist)